MKPKDLSGVLKQTFAEFSKDKVPRLGAALAYYTIFSIAPMLLISIAIAGMIFGKSGAQHEIVQQLKTLLGAAAGTAIEEMLRSAAKPKAGMIATIVGVITLIFGASGVFGELHDGINTIWDVEPKKTSGVMGFIKQRFLSVAMVMGVCFLLLVSLLLDSAIAAMSGWMGNRLPGGKALWHAIEMGVSLVVVAVLFSMIFRFLPDLKIEWRDVISGGVFTAILFVIGKFALGIYLGKAAVGSSYGAAGSLVLLLVWIYYSAQILYFGAEFTQVYAKQLGSLKSSANEKAGAKAAIEPLASHVPAGAGGAAGQARPALIYRTQKAGSGAGKLALGGAAGLAVGALVGVFGGLVIMVKSVKKMFV